jgi:hypothetical protein
MLRRKVLPVLDGYLLLYFLEVGIWNLDHFVTCGIPNANTYGIPRNSGQFYSKKYRGILYVFQKIPYSVGSQKPTSVDTLLASVSLLASDFTDQMCRASTIELKKLLCVKYIYVYGTIYAYTVHVGKHEENRIYAT